MNTNFPFFSHLQALTEAETKLANGTPVSWVYRSGTGHGYITGVHADADKASDVEYSIHQVDNHVGPDGSKEPSTVFHKRSDITVSTKDAVENAKKAAQAKS